MTRIKNSLNSIGLGLLLAGLMALRVWPYKKALGLALLVLGVAALASYFVFHLSSLKKSFRRKAFLYSSNLLVIVFLVLGILVLANYFLAKHHYRVDFTAAKLHSLSDQSVTVLQNLKQDVAVKAFFRESNMGRGTMENLLKIYGYHSGKIKFEFIDPDKNPGLVKRYDVTQDGTTIFEAGDKDSRITSTSEEDVTNALIKITRDKKKVIYFLEGHGEQAIEDSGDDGYSTAKSELEKLGYEVKKLTLALSENFPSDCALLIIPGPQKDLLPNELETIKKTLEGGGRFFFMADPEVAPGLAPYLAQFGIKLENDLIVDTVSRLLGGDYFMPVISEYEDHEITRKFRYATFFPFARSVSPSETKPEGTTVTVLAKTSPNSWSERQLDQKQVAFDKDKDVQGPLSVAVVETIKTKTEEKKDSAAGESRAETKPEEEKPAEKEGRLAVFGDSNFIANRYYGLSGNGNFFLNTVNWLTEESDLISIQPKTQTPKTIQLSPVQMSLLKIVSLYLLPGLVLGAGILIWVRRRSL